MRLSDKERSEIVRQVAEAFGPSAEVRLFGSRVDDSARGGDIDLLVQVDRAIPNRASAEARLAGRLERRLGGRHVDVVLVDPATPPQPIHEAARKRGLVL
jgi:predicted nucleotidyltransferase